MSEPLIIAGGAALPVSVAKFTDCVAPARSSMSQTLLFEPLLMPVGWIAISTQTVAIRAESVDHKKALRTLHLERYIPLH